MNFKSLKSLALLASSAVFPAIGFAAPDPNFHIYLMFGQSNMEGQGVIGSQDYNVPDGLLVMHDDDACTQEGASYGEWRTATPPLIRCQSNHSGGANTGIGPGDYFGRDMLAGSPQNVKVGLVGAAYQGQPIEFFLKNCGSNCSPRNGNGTYPLNQGGYAWLIDLAKRAQQDGVIKGIIMHQGESNTGDTSWPGKVNQVVSDLRADLGLTAEQAPFIAGEMVPGVCCTSHNAQVHRIPDVVANGHYVSASGLSNKDQYHFNAASYRELGRRYAAKMLEVADLSSEPLDCDTTSDGTPICCDISADPDGDGWGTQNESEMCIVTPDTYGYNPPEILAAINVGGGDNDEAEIFYKRDQFFSGGQPHGAEQAVSGGNGHGIYETERYGEFTYEIPVSEQSVEVELSFVELYHTTAGSRVFGVTVEGTELFNGLDLVAEVGTHTVYKASTDATVNDGSLTIDVNYTTDNGTLSAILVKAKEAAASSSSVSSSSTPVSSSSVAVSSAPASSSSAASSAPTTPAPRAGSISGLWLALLGLSVMLARRFRKH